MAGLLWPINGHVVTQEFDGTFKFEPAGYLANDGSGARRGRRRAFTNGLALGHLHGAVDISCPIDTPILAPETGKIVATSVYESTGERFSMLEIRPGVILFFTHLHTWTAKVGQHVVRGEEIARSGNSGMSTGPHLHWEVRITMNPEPDFRRSAGWFKWNPRRLRSGGDLAGLAAIVPLGVAAQPTPQPAPPVVDPDPAPPIATDPEPEPDPAEPPPVAEEDDEDGYGDAAVLIERGLPLVGRTGKPMPY
jgi:murein DD-endopeptidase MepM/ murein hydrolase activator NlpD